MRGVLSPGFLLVLASGAVAQSTVRASLASAGGEADGASLRAWPDADGRRVAFDSDATNLVAGDTNGCTDVFVRELAAGRTVRASVDSAGAEGNGASSACVLSADGRWVAFQSLATSLVAGDTNLASDVFVHDLVLGTTLRASVDANGIQGFGDSVAPALSADGRCVAFASRAQLVAADMNGNWDVYVRDLSSGTIVWASVGLGGAQPGGDSTRPALSADGRWVAFESSAAALVAGDTNQKLDVFVRDLATGTTVRASVDSAGSQVFGDSRRPALSADGRCVGFESSAATLVAGDTNNAYDVFVRDLPLGTTARASVDSQGIEGGSFSGWTSLSADGRFVCFSSAWGGFDANDTNLAWDVFLHDRASGATWLLSADAGGAPGNDHSQGGVLTPDARFATFASAASNLDPNDLNQTWDVFLRDRELASLAFCFGDATQATLCPCANVGANGRGCENSAASGGARLAAYGTSVPDTLLLAVVGELPSALSIFLQGDVELATPTPFGDGLRCVSGTLKRLYVEHAAAGATSAPNAGELAIRAQSALLGDPIAPGSTRVYQVYYRDPSASFCSAPQGNTWNVSNGVRVSW